MLQFTETAVVCGAVWCTVRWSGRPGGPYQASLLASQHINRLLTAARHPSIQTASPCLQLSPYSLSTPEHFQCLFLLWKSRDLFLMSGHCNCGRPTRYAADYCLPLRCLPGEKRSFCISAWKPSWLPGITNFY